MNNAVQSVTSMRVPYRLKHWLRDRGTLVDALMRAGRVVVNDKLLQNPSQMSFIEDNQLIQALLTNRSNPTFGQGIGIGRPKGREHEP